jgi:hypothetical protein
MSERFVYVGAGYVNLRHVDQVRINKDGRHTLISNGKVVDENNAQFAEAIVSVIPVQGEWECLSSVAEDDGSFTAYAEPVLAWGWTATGCLLPITPGELQGVIGGFALRRVGTARIYGMDTNYPDTDAWLAALNKE